MSEKTISILQGSMSGSLLFYGITEILFEFVTIQKIDEYKSSFLLLSRYKFSLYFNVV